MYTISIRKNWINRCLLSGQFLYKHFPTFLIEINFWNFFFSIIYNIILSTKFFFNNIILYLDKQYVSFIFYMTIHTNIYMYIGIFRRYIMHFISYSDVGGYTVPSFAQVFRKSSALRSRRETNNRLNVGRST